MNTIGIIGGTGIIGGLFKKNLTRLGLTVMVSDETSPDKEREILDVAQLIIVCVPIAITIDVIRRIRPHLRNDVVLTEFTSVKSHVCAELMQCPCEVISCHPLFGPIDSLQSQNMIMIPIKPGPGYPKLYELWKSLRLNIVEIENCQKHDEYMSVIQGLVHFLHIIFVTTLRRLNPDLQRLIEICSPVYRSYFAFSCRITGGSENLYTDIIMDNPSNVAVIEKVTAVSSSLLDLIRRGDHARFIKNFTDNQEFLGEHLGEFVEESNFLVNKLSELVVKKQTNGH